MMASVGRCADVGSGEGERPTGDRLKFTLGLPDSSGNSRSSGRFRRGLASSTASLTWPRLHVAEENCESQEMSEKLGKFNVKSSEFNRGQGILSLESDHTDEKEW